MPSASTSSVYITVALLGLVFLAAFILCTCTFPNQLIQFCRPLQWAVLCSIPLRGIQHSLVAFLSQTLLHLGLIQTLLSLPLALITVFFSTLLEIREASLSFILRKPRPANQPPGSRFSNLLRLLFSFWIFIIAYEHLGGFWVLSLLGLGFIFTLNRIVLSVLSYYSWRRNRNSRLRHGETSVSFTRGTLERLRIIVAVTLIVGFLTGLLFFSYKIGVEGKGAAIYLKMHMKETNYAVKKWLDENNVADMVVSHTTKLYDTLSDLAAQYNMTEFVTTIEHFAITCGDFVQTAQEFSIKSFQSQRLSARNRDRDMLGSSTAEFMIYIANFIISAAAQVYNFVSQVMVFISFLYYLIISESDGLIAQVMGMLPISDHTKNRCEEILNRANSVLSALIKIAFSQGCLTWLLFRLFKIHFLYMSTVFTFMSPLMPIFPSWLVTIQAAMQLVLEGRYIVAIVLSVVHLFLMNYVESQIMKDVPENFAHLTGLSIIGGVTLFPSNLEGAIMGLLIAAVVIAMKDLYAELVSERNQGQRVTAETEVVVAG